MANNRVFYACQAVAIAPCFVAPTTSNVRLAQGVQSVGITTNFNLEQAFELGQIQIYENIEGLPDVEVTMEKVLDGNPLLYHLASPTAETNSLVGRSTARSCISLGIYEDDKDVISGAAPTEVYMSGMYINSVSYTIPTDGNATESITLVGNHKEWASNGAADNLNANNVKLLGKDITQKHPAAPQNDGGRITGSGAPPSGIQRREDVDLAHTELPASIQGASGVGAGNAKDDGGNVVVHIQNFTCSSDFSREDILELGRKAPYFRATAFPIEVTCEFEVIATSGDFIGCDEDADTNTNEETIEFALKSGTRFNLGTKNRLSSVTYGGGDAGGGNATITYSYTNFNDLSVFSRADPAGLS